MKLKKTTDYKIKSRFKSKKLLKKNFQKRKTMPRKTRKLRCSPKEKDKMNEFTCYTDDSLYKLIN